LRAILRLVDANANRAREAARVLEDYARFVLNDAPLSARLKRLRHGLVAALAPLAARMTAARDVAGDLGRGEVVRSEYRRANEADLVRANAARLEEALRSLEEFSKIDSPARARKFEKLRFAAYEAAQLMDVFGAKKRKLARLRIYALLSSELVDGSLDARARMLVKAGVDAIQLREKTMADGPYIALARRLCRVCRRAGALFFVNDRVHVCEIADADGVHLGQDDTPVDAARSALCPTRIVGLSTHNMAQARKAKWASPDYISVGPVFATPLKAARRPVGVSLVRRAAAATGLPVVAIGGVDGSSAEELFNAGAQALALSRPMCQAPDIERKIKEMREIASVCGGEKA